MRIITFLLLVSWAASAQAPSFAWTKNIGGTLSDAAGPITCDASGNIYSTGWFTNATLELDGQTLTNNAGSNANAYLAKWDTDGNLIWAKTFGGQANQYVGSFRGAVTVDPDGNSYVAVESFGTSININATNHSINSGNPQYVDYAIVKYSPDGTHLWTKFISGNNNDSVGEMTLDHSGDLVFAVFSGSTNLTVAGVAIDGSPERSIVRLSAADGHLMTSMPTSLINRFIFDDLGNMYLVGDFSSTVTIGTTSLTPLDVAPYIGSGDIALYKITADGSVAWVRQYGGNREERAHTISFDHEGNIIITGTFMSQSVDFGGVAIAKIQSISDFLVKVDTDGNTIYAKHANINQYGSMDISDLYTSDDGSMYITGFNTGTMDLNGLTYITPYLPEHSYTQFVAKLDADGNGIWMKHVGGMWYGSTRYFAVDYQEKIFISGFYSAPSTSFDSVVMANPGTNTQNSYLAKLDPDVLETPYFVAQKTVVYPSPAETMLYVSNSDVQDYKILDMMGRIISSGETSGQVDVSGLKTGTYYLSIAGSVVGFLKK